MDESKPWYRSLTIVPTLIVTLTAWAVSMGFISTEEQAAANTLLDSIVQTVTHAGAFLAVVGLRRAVSPIQGPGSGATTIAAAGIVVLLVGACASYNAAAVQAEATKHIGADEIFSVECTGFEIASAALVEGPNKTITFFGRAGELRALSDQMARQGAICHEAVARFDMSPEQLQSLRSAFDRTWSVAQEAVQ